MYTDALLTYMAVVIHCDTTHVHLHLIPAKLRTCNKKLSAACACVAQLEAGSGLGHLVRVRL